MDDYIRLKIEKIYLILLTVDKFRGGKTEEIFKLHYISRLIF